MISLKLKFQTTQTTHLEASIISKRILRKLEDKKYEIKEVSNSTIVFGRPIFELVWNFEVPHILDGGSFELIESENGITVVLNYFIKTFYLILIFTSISIFLINLAEYMALLLFGLFFLFTGIIQFFTTRNVGQKLLKEIIDGHYRLDD